MSDNSPTTPNVPMSLVIREMGQQLDRRLDAMTRLLEQRPAPEGLPVAELRALRGEVAEVKRLLRDEKVWREKAAEEREKADIERAAVNKYRKARGIPLTQPSPAIQPQPSNAPPTSSDATSVNDVVSKLPLTPIQKFVLLALLKSSGGGLTFLLLYLLARSYGLTP